MDIEEEYQLSVDNLYQWTNEDAEEADDSEQVSLFDLIVNSNVGSTQQSVRTMKTIIINLELKRLCNLSLLLCDLGIRR